MLYYTVSCCTWRQVCSIGHCLQVDSEGRVQLWVAVAYPMWQEVDVKAVDAMEQATARVTACVEVLLQQSRTRGFPADLLPSGRAPPPHQTWELSMAIGFSPHAWHEYGILIRADIMESLIEHTEQKPVIFRQVCQHGHFGPQLCCTVWGTACCSACRSAYSAGFLLLPFIRLPCQPTRMEQVWTSLASALLISAGAISSFIEQSIWVVCGVRQHQQEL
jgi:hypothetical protein